jgi:hypothetical protein
MADTYTDRLGLIEMELGSHSNEWGTLANLNFDRLDSASRGYIKITLAGAESLDANDITTTGSTAQEESFFAFIELAGTAGTVTVPAEDIVWIVRNNSDGAVTWTPSGGTGTSVPVGATRMLVYGSSGTTMVDVTSELAGVGVLTQAFDAVLEDLSALSEVADNEFIVGTGAGTYAHESGATARTSMGVGTGDSPQFTGIELGHASDTTLTRDGDGGDVLVEGNTMYRAGGTDVAVTDGGTGLSTITSGHVLYASGADTIAAAAPGATSGVQAYNVELTSIAALGQVADNEIIVGTGAGTYAHESGATARTSLGAQAENALLTDLSDIAATFTADGEFIVGTGAGTCAIEAAATALASIGGQASDTVLTEISGLGTVADNEVIIGTGAGTYAHESGATLLTSIGAQTVDAVLTDLSALSEVADNEFIVGNGAGSYAHESGATARTSMGLGTAATQNTGTSGANLPFLNGANTWSATQSFGDQYISDVLIDDYGLAHGTVTAASSVTFTMSTDHSFYINLTTNVTSITLDGQKSSGDYCEIVIHVRNNASYTMAGWPAAVKWAGGSAPTITTGSGSLDKIFLSTYDGGTTWWGDFSQDYS